MKLKATTLFSVVLFIIIQLLIDNYLSLGVRVHISILPILILTFSYKYDTIVMMLIAFGLGLSIDIFSNGILGLNAAALITVAFTRETLLRYLVNQKSIEKKSAPSAREMGLVPYLIYILFSYTIFFAIYIPLETMSISSQHIVKFILSILVNVIIAYTLGSLLQSKR